MIGILHGYLLDGSGSNLWTRNMVQALCAAGEEVHLVCQEPHPERFPFVGAAHEVREDGSVHVLFERPTPFPGRCTLHRPWIGQTLPVYVPDRYESFERVVPMTELPTADVEAYLGRNVAAVVGIVERHGLRVLHANHAVLMPTVARRVRESLGMPFTILPHGSALEYAVRRDPRFHALAAEAMAQAGAVLAVGEEMRTRILDIFPEVAGLAAHQIAPPGCGHRALRAGRAGGAGRPSRATGRQPGAVATRQGSRTAHRHRPGSQGGGGRGHAGRGVPGCLRIPTEAAGRRTGRPPGSPGRWCA